jgi:hypothetical protein
LEKATTIAASSMEKKNKWKKQCPKCGKDQYYQTKRNLNRAIKKHSLCGQGGCRFLLEETKKKISNAVKGENNGMFGKPSWNKGKTEVYSGEILKQLSEMAKKGITGMLGRKHNKKTIQKMSESAKGKIISEESKKLMRISKLKRLEKLGIGAAIDNGSKEWFEKYNKENHTNYKSKKFIDIGYIADGYDDSIHSWIEYDTPYHNTPTRQQKDLMRQNNIIKYFKSIEKPLNSFKRYITWKSELKTVCGGQQYV